MPENPSLSMNRRPVKSTRIFSDALLGAFRQQGDEAADAVVASAVANGTSLPVFLRQRTTGSVQTDYPAFFTKEGKLPGWADARKLERGRAFFRKHKPEIAILLGCLSLPYSYLGADGVQVLALSRRMQDDTRKRLEETGAFVFAMAEEGGWASGEAVERILNVRLMHAAVRRLCLESGRWKGEWGVPVNLEDMAGTNLSFGYLVLRGLRKGGLQADDADEEAFLHLWNVIGALSGVPDELLPHNTREAWTLERAMVRRLFRPTPEGRQLAEALIHTLEAEMPGAMKGMVPARMRLLLGDELADLLGLPAVPVQRRWLARVPVRLFLPAV